MIFKIPRQSFTAEFKREAVTLQSPEGRIVASAGSVNDGAALSREAAGRRIDFVFLILDMASSASSGNDNPRPDSQTGNAEDETVPERARWSVDWARPEDETELLELFRRVFGHPISAAQWRWKYSPETSAGTVVRRQGKVVAFYGGIPRPIHFRGRPAMAVQIGDVMVDPAERGVLTRKGPIFLATSMFLEQRIGVGKPYSFGFGFPTERHMKVAERLGLYVKVDELLEATWPALPRYLGLTRRARPLLPEQMTAVDRLWSRMAASAGEVAIGVRDAAYVRHRFLDHPTVRYLCLLVTPWLRRDPLGLVVLRDRGTEGVELIDVVGPPGAICALVDAARRAAGRLHRSRLFAWLTPSAARWFAESRATLTPTGFVIPASRLDVPANALQVHGRWWLTGGDTDFR